LSWLVEVANASRVSRTLRWIGRRLDGWVTGEPETEISGTLTDLLGPCDLSSGSMPLLAMGRDVANGRIFLKPDRKGRQKYLDVDWKMQQSGPHFKRVRDTCDEIATRLGGRFGQNPGTRYFRRIITVHPLGGCPMGRSEREGVVDSHGEVFGYPGFYIA